MRRPHLPRFRAAEVRFKVPRRLRAVECWLAIPCILNRRRLVNGIRVKDGLQISGHTFPACGESVDGQGTLLQRPCHVVQARKCRLTRGFATSA
jgi:hypothetical protein